MLSLLAVLFVLTHLRKSVIAHESLINGLIIITNDDRFIVAALRYDNSDNLQVVLAQKARINTMSIRSGVLQTLPQKYQWFRNKLQKVNLPDDVDLPNTNTEQTFSSQNSVHPEKA